MSGYKQKRHSDDSSSDDDFRQPFRKKQRLSRETFRGEERTDSSDSDDDDDDEEDNPKENNDDEVEMMMKQLADEEEAGKFRALAGKYVRLAIDWHEKRAADRIPGPSAAFSADMQDAHIRVGTPGGFLLATGCTKTVTDEHGCYIQFSISQLSEDARNSAVRQRSTGFSSEYCMTKFHVGNCVDIYYAGNDPFAAAWEADKRKKADEEEPPRKFCVFASADIAKKFSEPKDTDATPVAKQDPDDSTKTANASAQLLLQQDPIVMRGFSRQTTLTKFLRRDTDDATVSTAEGKKKKAAAGDAVVYGKVKPKHAKFDRNMFYVRALDVYCVKKHS